MTDGERMTDAEIDAIEALANAATEGPWVDGPYGRGNGLYVKLLCGDQFWRTFSIPRTSEDRAFIAATDPPTVLRLCASLRAATALPDDPALDVLVTHLRRWGRAGGVPSSSEKAADAITALRLRVAELETLLRSLYGLADELTDAVDLEAEDVGGSRGSLVILREIGPLLGPIKAILEHKP